MTDGAIRSLWDVLDWDSTSKTNYCHSDRYPTWEDEIAGPALEAGGYRVLAVMDGDSDGFGPLTRVFIVEKGDQTDRLVYG